MQRVASATVALAVAGSLALLTAGCSQNDQALAQLADQVVCNAGPDNSPSLVGLVSAPGQPVSANGKTQAWMQQACSLAGAVVATSAQIAAAEAQSNTAGNGQTLSISGATTPIVASVQIDPTKVSASTGVSVAPIGIKGQ